MSKSAEHAATALQGTLAGISTNDLIGELLSREGIACYTVNDGEPYHIQKTGDNGTEVFERYCGPTTIITVVDT